MAPQGLKTKFWSSENQAYNAQTVRNPYGIAYQRILETAHQSVGLNANWSAIYSTITTMRSPTLLKTVHRQNFILYIYSWSWKNVLILTIKWHNIIWRPVINFIKLICIFAFGLRFLWGPSKALYERIFMSTNRWQNLRKKQMKKDKRKLLDRLKAPWYSKQTVDSTHYLFTFGLYFRKTKKIYKLFIFLFVICLNLY